MPTNLKALCFTGRDHHLDKMSGTMDFLRKQGISFEIIVSNNVLNWDNYERPLVDNHVPYETIYEYLDDHVMHKINKHSALAQQYINNTLYSAHNILDYVEEFHVRFSMRDLVEVTELFRSVLIKKKPDFTFILHEANYWGKILAYVSHEMGVKTISLQEAPYFEYIDTLKFHAYQIFAEYSSLVFLCGERDLQAYKDYGCYSDNLRVVGPHQYDQYINRNQETQIKQLKEKYQIENRKVVLLSVSSKDLLCGDRVELLQSVIQYVSQNQNLFLIIRFHPCEMYWGKQLNYLWKDFKNIVWENNTVIYDLLPIVDLCLLQESNVRGDCLAFNVPIVEINFSKEHKIGRSFYDQGWADKISHPDELTKISEILFENKSEVVPAAIENFIEHHFYKLDGKSNERIYNEIVKLLNQNN
ncbi:MAG: hypothetical protein OET79_05535 [Nitrospirota bacterium]|nr:hypothetical protein [Nitrospirota bacterium]